MERARESVELPQHQPASPLKEKDMPLPLLPDDESVCSSMSPSTCSSNSSSYYSTDSAMLVGPETEPSNNEVHPITVTVSGTTATFRRGCTEFDDDFFECLEAEVKELAAADDKAEVPHQLQQPQPQDELEPPPTLSSAIGESAKEVKITQKVVTGSDEHKTVGFPKRKNRDANMEADEVVKVKKAKSKIPPPEPPQFSYEDKAEGAKLVIDVLMPYYKNKIILNDSEFKWLAKQLTHKALKKGFGRDKAKIEEYVVNKFKWTGAPLPDVPNGKNVEP